MSCKCEQCRNYSAEYGDYGTLYSCECMACVYDEGKEYHEQDNWPYESEAENCPDFVLEFWCHNIYTEEVDGSVESFDRAYQKYLTEYLEPLLESRQPYQAVSDGKTNQALNSDKVGRSANDPMLGLGRSAEQREKM